VIDHQGRSSSPSGHVRERLAILFMSAAGQATAFSGEVEASSPQKTRQTQQSWSGFRFQANGNRSKVRFHTPEHLS
jgi:hypothetical protein